LTAAQAAEQAAAVAATEESAAEAARAEAFQLAALRAEEGHRAQAAARLRPELAQAEAAALRAEETVPLAGQVERREEELRAATFVEAARGQHAERSRYVSHQRQVLARLQAELAGLVVPVLDGGGTDAGNGLVQIEANIQERASELAVLGARLKEAEARRQRFQQLAPGSPCPLCERPLEEVQHLHEEVAESFQGLLSRCRQAEADVARLRFEADGVRLRLESSRRKAAEAQHAALRRAELEKRAAEEAHRLAELEAMVGPAPPAPPDLPRLRASCLEARRAREELARLLGLAARKETLAAQLAEAAAAHAVAVVARQALESVHKPADEGRLLEARRRRDSAVSQVHLVERRLHASQLAAQQARSDNTAATHRLAEAGDLVRRVADVERELHLWNAVVGRSGGGLLDRFRDHLVGRVGPAISAEASRLLAGFSGGRYSEILLDDEYQVFVTDNGVPYALERFSGGEADLVHLALRLAVSRLLAERGGVELRFLALDEVFGSLDQERRDLVVATLQSLGTLYSQVLVVSHLEGLQETLGHVLRVSEDADGNAIVALE
ncbi:MAG: SbcC/MukB-like Walker B domain-containing protein, partial [Thermoplasmatota archaeon]